MLYRQCEDMINNHFLNASCSRNLLSNVLLTQLGNRATFCNYEELVWLMSGFDATGANLVISSASNRRARLMDWMAKMKWPSGWLLWPDQQIIEQREELDSFGFRPAQDLAQMTIESSLVPSIISNYENPILRSIRFAGPSDFNGLASHYSHLHNIPINYACQLARAHLGINNQNICSTWVIANRCEVLAAITAYTFGSLGLISWLATCPTLRRQGIGSALLLHALNYLKFGGVDKIELQAVPEAIRLYQEIGFTKEYEVELWMCFGSA